MESKRRHLGIVVVFVAAQLVLFVSAQDCLQAAGQTATPFRDDNGSPRLPSGTQAIITSYKFRCCGNITAWQTYVQPAGRMHQMGAYDITFQVWRPSPTVQVSGCYSLVGENKFTSLSLDGGGLVSETPKPSNILTVQPGDVVGYYTFSRKDPGNSGIQLVTRENPENPDNVWYDTISESELQNVGLSNCPFPVGTESRKLLTTSTSAAPVLSVDVSSSTCPPTPTSTISQPLLTPTPLLSSTSESTVVTSLDTDNSPSDTSQQPASPTSDTSQSASPTSDTSQQPASPTSDTSQQPASPTSDTSQQPASPTSDTSQSASPTSDTSQQPASPTSDTSQQPASPTSDTSQQPASPTSDTSQQPASPTSDTSQQPASDTSQQPASPTSDTSQQPTSDTSQSASPTSDTSQQPASPTTDTSQQPTSPISDMSQQSATTTSDMLPFSSNPLGGVVAGVVVVVVSVLVVPVVLVVLLLLWKRKRSQNNMKSEVSGKNIHLPNPSYGFRGPEVVTPTYEGLDIEEPMDCMDPTASYTTIADASSNNYAHILNPHNNKDVVYHAVGPKVRHCGTDRASNKYSSPSSHPSPVPTRSENGHKGLSSLEDSSVLYEDPTLPKFRDVVYHAMGPKVRHCGTDRASNKYSSPSSHPSPVPTRSENGHKGLSSLEDSSVLYEDPTLPKFREHNSIKQNELLESSSYCVPTKEQRKVFGPNYEQQYDHGSVAYNKLNFFVEDQIYWAPAGTTSGLYGQLASKRYREIQRDQLKIMEKLGSGQFGEVCRALWTVEGCTLELAVKTMKPGASEEDKVKFLQEAAINGQFSHSNVIKMHGIITLGEPVLICLEILSNGDLRSYLQGLKLSGSKHGDFMEAGIMFLKFAKDIAAGMDYLSQKSFVHRDLAARNILLDKSLTCKVADFGMARDLMDDTYYKSSGGQIPVKWTSPEALLYKKYSADSDVWSYGMVLFEIWSVGKKPFSTVTNNQVLRLIQKGFCQAPPPGCPRAIYELMVDCWNPDHPSRPSFSKISSSYLQQSSDRILYWAPEDETLSPAVCVCGASLEEGYKLHLDLQEKYTNCGKIF